MDWLSQLAQWVRNGVGDQTPTLPIRQFLDRAPNWAILATPVAFLSLMSWLSLHLSKSSAAIPKVKTRGPAGPRDSAVSATRFPQPAAPPLAGSSPKISQSAFQSDDDRAVRVFISSTFIDMQNERDVLVRQTFPALRARFRARGVELLEVDLRWGITQEQAESGKTLPTLLAEIDRCRPYFIGLLGERYGWVPPEAALTAELKASYPSLANAAGRSVTEMEIIHGVLSNPDAAKRAIFFERDPAWLGSENADERARYTSDDQGRTQLADLKARIRASGAQVIAYATPAEIGPAVETALTHRIEAQFPDTEAPDAFAATARLHAAYARERRGVHIGAASYLTTLDAWVNNGRDTPMLVSGASGGGKSTLIANWISHHRAAAPKDIVFEHYLGASPESADPITTIQRLWEFLNRATGERIAQPSADQRVLVQGLPARLELAHAFAELSGINVLIALDGLDKLSSEQHLGWLPIKLPPRIRLLASSLDGPTHKAAESRGWLKLTVNSLTHTEQRDFIDRALDRWGRGLSLARTERILACPLSASPLFLKTLLDELRVAGIENELDLRLDDYLAAESIPDLFERVLSRLERDCGAEFVGNATALIWASRGGLEESELIAITGVQPLAWATLRNGLSEGLRDQVGRVAFSHDFLRQGVEERYLASDLSKQRIHRKLGDRYIEQIREFVASSESSTHTPRYASEIFYHLRSAGMWDEIVNCLEDDSVLRWVPKHSLGLAFDGDTSTFGGPDADSLTANCLQEIPPAQRLVFGIRVAEVFGTKAAACMDRIFARGELRAETAERLRQSDVAGFKAYRNDFYHLVGFGKEAAVWAHATLVGSDETTARARDFMESYGTVYSFLRYLGAEGTAVTGLSGQLEVDADDACPPWRALGKLR